MNALKLPSLLTDTVVRAVVNMMYIAIAKVKGTKLAPIYIPMVLAEPIGSSASGDCTKFDTVLWQGDTRIIKPLHYISTYSLTENHLVHKYYVDEALKIALESTTVRTVEDKVPQWSKWGFYRWDWSTYWCANDPRVLEQRLWASRPHLGCNYIYCPSITTSYWTVPETGTYYIYAFSGGTGMVFNGADPMTSENIDYSNGGAGNESYLSCTLTAGDVATVVLGYGGVNATTSTPATMGGITTVTVNTNPQIQVIASADLVQTGTGLQQRDYYKPVHNRHWVSFSTHKPRVLRYPRIYQWRPHNDELRQGQRMSPDETQASMGGNPEHQPTSGFVIIIKERL